MEIKNFQRKREQSRRSYNNENPYDNYNEEQSLLTEIHNKKNDKTHEYIEYCIGTFLGHMSRMERLDKNKFNFTHKRTLDDDRVVEIKVLK